MDAKKDKEREISLQRAIRSISACEDKLLRLVQEAQDSLRDIRDILEDMEDMGKS